MNAKPQRPSRRTLLQPTAIACAAFACAGGAHAQATAPAAPARAASAPAAETIVITGFRASIESALTKKREDSGIVDVIRAEDISKFPDTTWPNRCSACRAS